MAISSVAVAMGVFRGGGRVVEIPSLPTDPPNISRDDLVYPEGTMHLVSTTVGASFTVNPHNCRFRGTLQQSSEIAGGTGLFVNAAGTFTGTVSPQGAARNPDGSCSFTLPSLHEVGQIAFSGTLSFRPRSDDEHRCSPAGTNPAARRPTMKGRLVAAS